MSYTKRVLLPSERLSDSNNGIIAWNSVLPESFMNSVGILWREHSPSTDVETVVRRRWETEKKFVFIKRVDKS